MKRVFFGFVWFVFLAFGGIVIGSAIAGGIAGAQVEAQSVGDAYKKGEAVGSAAGAEFGSKYGNMILLGSLALSIVGTGTGVLPGTKARRKADEDKA